MKHIMVIIVLGFLAQSISAQNAFGTWKTIDEETGEPKSVVRVYEEDGLIYGEIMELFLKPNADQNPVCENCKGEKKGQPIIGMVIMEGLSKSGTEYSGGTIIDPDSGKIYDCKIWLDGKNKLMVRGYVGLFFRTQEWIRI
ncbi:MAG: DUF2147 domain-containing protein [Flavobacteriales bacterium]